MAPLHTLIAQENTHIHVIFFYLKKAIDEQKKTTEHGLSKTNTDWHSRVTDLKPLNLNELIVLRKKIYLASIKRS